MKHTKVTQKDILLLSISFFFIVLIWVGSNLYHEYASTTISKDLQEQIIPIDPKFDTKTLDALKSRTKVEPFTNIIIPSQRASSEATITPEEEVLLEETLSPTPEEPVIIEEELTPSPQQTQ